MKNAGRALRTHLDAVIVVIAATLTLTWPLASQAGYHLLRGLYYYDGYTNAMILGSRVDALLGRGPLSLYDNYFFAPLPESIVYNENLFALALFFGPLYVLTDNPLWAYNVTLLASLGASAFFTYLLVRRLTGEGHAGILAGVAFAFSPYVMFEIGRLQLVATQWIPLCFLMLWRAVESRRWHDLLGFAGAYLLQIGTCLYYAMFLVPLLGVALVALCFRERPERRFYVRLVASAALTAVCALLLVQPYFDARNGFSLERSLSFASSYDGKLDYLFNVHPTNRTLTWMHHQPNVRMAYEQVAFPGFVAVSLATLGLGSTLLERLRSAPLSSVGFWTARARRVAPFAAAVALGLGLVFVTYSLLPLAMLVAVALIVTGFKTPRRGGGYGLFWGLWFLALVLFLGLFPFEIGGRPVRGLYYYLHTYFPGFNGIRKVSRQAVMVTFLTVVLAGFGAHVVLRRFPAFKSAITLALLLLTGFELRSFPHDLELVWAGPDVPRLYEYLRRQPPGDLVAALPQNDGTRLFRGDAGLTLHNYLMLYHKHRSLNGQSSWQPPVTDLVLGALRSLPKPEARRVLQSLELRHLIVHGAELPPRLAGLPEQLERDSSHYELEFQDGRDKVFRLLQDPDPSLALTRLAPLPEDVKEVARQHLRASASVGSDGAPAALDGDQRTAFSTRVSQAPGQYFELRLDEPRRVVALEFENRYGPVQLPLSFEVSGALGTGELRSLVRQEQLRVPHELVYAPRKYVFRVVLPEAQLLDRLRVTVLQPVPGWPLTVREAHVFEHSPAELSPN